MVHWHHTSDPADCANANDAERTSAEWGYMCVPDANGLTGDAAADAAKAAASSGSTMNVVCSTSQPGSVDINCHPATSAITFGELDAQAASACPNMELDQQRTCIEDAKLKFLLANDSYVGAECAAVTNHSQLLSCANIVYLCGPNAPWKNDLRSALRVSMSEGADNLPDWIKALPGAQPDTPTVSGDAADTIDGVETNAKDAAALIALAVPPRAGAKLAAQDRKTCMAVTYTAVLAMMKAGRPPVPPVCARVVAAARAEFASFARNGYTGSRGLNALLVVLGSNYQKPGDLFGDGLVAPQPARPSSCRILRPGRRVRTECGDKYEARRRGE